MGGGRALEVRVRRRGRVNGWGEVCVCPALPCPAPPCPHVARPLLPFPLPPQVFLTKVAAHPVLKEVPELSTFLRAGDEEWTMEMARWQVCAEGRVMEQGGGGRESKRMRGSEDWTMERWLAGGG